MVKVQDLIELLPYIMKAGEVPLLVGHAGIGKTEIIKTIGKRTKRKVIILSLSQMEPGDLIGMPDRKEDKTIWLKPDWMPEDDNTILFLDEINRSNEHIRSAVMQLLLDRRIHEHKLPKGTWVVAAMNPETEDYSVDTVFDKAFIDRFVWLKVSNSFEDWKQYANNLSKNRGKKYLRALEELYKQDIYSFAISETFELLEITPTPRAHMRAIKLLDTLPAEIMNKYGYELLIGILGKTYGKLMYNKVNSMLNINAADLYDLLEGNVEAFNNATMQVKANVANNFVNYILENELSDKELENVSKVFRIFKNEELGPIIRSAIDDKQIDTIIKSLMQRNADFSNIIISAIAGENDELDILDKIV